MENKILVLLMVSLTLITFVSARGLIVPEGTIPINYSTVNTNHSYSSDVSDYAFNSGQLEGRDTATLLTYFQGLYDSVYCKLTGCTMTGNLTTTGNITASYFIGDGSQLTNVNGSSQWTTTGRDIYYNNGNVGIGTISPKEKLHLHSGGAVSFYLTNDNTGTTATDGFIFQLAADGTTYMGNRESANLHLYTGNSLTKGITVLSGGNVGIGTTTPTSKLHVVGDSNTTGDAYIGDDLLVTGDVGIGTTTPTHELNVVGDANITGALYVGGNVSFENPHLFGYDNSTQSFLTLETAQVMNLSNIDYHSHQIEIINNQNITFSRVGHYQVCASPQFYQASGNDKWITFWLQENGADVPWSNSRYTMDNDEYNAPRICWETIIDAPATDNVRIMWLSDSTSSQIQSITGLTDPVRPSVPGVIIDVHWISNGV